MNKKLFELKLKDFKVLIFNKFRYLHNNLIENIENLDDLIHLSTLNLSGNRFKELSGLSNLKQLTNLYVEKNNIESVEAIKPILDCPYIAVVSILIKNLNNKKTHSFIKQLTYLPK